MAGFFVEMNKEELNNIKSNLSMVYVRALASKLNYAFQETSRDVDGLGIDCMIFNHGIGTMEYYSASNEIKMQIKAFARSSKSMFSDKVPSELKYRLKKKLRPTGPVFYLVVIELPEEELFDGWLQCHLEEIILKGKAFYIRIKSEVEPGYVTIPRTNVLDLDSLPSLFINPDNKEKNI